MPTDVIPVGGSQFGAVPKPSGAPAGTVYASVPGVKATTGVALNAPPVGPIMAGVNKAISEAVASLPPGKQGGIVAVGNETGVNLAVVQKVGDSFAVTGWIGRSWKGTTVYGAAMQWTW